MNIVLCIRCKFPKFPKCLLQMILVFYGDIKVISHMLGLKNPIYNRNILFDKACEKKNTFIINGLLHQISERRLSRYYIDTWQINYINIEKLDNLLINKIVYYAMVKCDTEVFDKFIKLYDSDNFIFDADKTKYEYKHLPFIQKLFKHEVDLIYIRISKKTNNIDFLKSLYNTNIISPWVGNAIIHNNLMHIFPIPNLESCYKIIVKSKRFDLFNQIATKLKNLQISIKVFFKYPDSYFDKWINEWKNLCPLNFMKYLKLLVKYNIELFYIETAHLHNKELFHLLCKVNAPINIVKKYYINDSNNYMHYIIRSDNIDEFKKMHNKNTEKYISKAIVYGFYPVNILKHYYSYNIVNNYGITVFILAEELEDFIMPKFSARIYCEKEFFILCARYGHLSLFKKYYNSSVNREDILKFLKEEKLYEFIEAMN